MLPGASEYRCHLFIIHYKDKTLFINIFIWKARFILRLCHASGVIVAMCVRNCVGKLSDTTGCILDTTFDTEPSDYHVNIKAPRNVCVSAKRRAIGLCHTAVGLCNAISKHGIVRCNLPHEYNSACDDVRLALPPYCINRQVSDIRRTKSQHLKDSRTV